MSHLLKLLFFMAVACGGSSQTEPSSKAKESAPAKMQSPTSRNNQPPGQKCQLEINKASEKEMRKLDQVGPEQAKAIIKYLKEKRAEAKSNGDETWNFNSWTDLYKVKGITEAICEKNKSKLCINGSPVFGCKSGP